MLRHRVDDGFSQEFSKHYSIKLQCTRLALNLINEMNLIQSDKKKKKNCTSSQLVMGKFVGKPNAKYRSGILLGSKSFR